MAKPAFLLLLASIGGLPLPAYEPELAHRQRSTAGLRDTLVAADHLGLLAAPLASARVLFRQHHPPAPARVLAQARHLFEAFHTWSSDFQALCPGHCLACRAVPGLPLQVLAHAEPAASTAESWPGQAEAVPHNLLAREVLVPEYVLLTNYLLGPNQRAAAAWVSARCGQLGNVGYVYLPLRDRRAGAKAGNRLALLPASLAYFLTRLTRPPGLKLLT